MRPQACLDGDNYDHDNHDKMVTKTITFFLNSADAGVIIICQIIMIMTKMIMTMMIMIIMIVRKMVMIMI